MRAAWRLSIAVAAAGAALLASPALAQSAPPAESNTAAPATIGPRELQNFSLEGTVTRPAEPQATRETPAPSRAPAATANTQPPSRTTAAPPTAQATSRADPEEAATAVAQTEPRPEPETTSPGSSTPSAQLPAIDAVPAAATDGLTDSASAAPGFTDDTAGSAETLTAQNSLPLWPWLLAAVALGAGAAFLLWRRNSREAFAGGPQVDAYAPLPRAPAPAPAPAKPRPPAPSGIVATRLRPWIDIAFEPARCIVDDEQVRFEFELSLFNSGSASARDLLIEARLFNASPSQDQEIGAFFANPVGLGDRIPALHALKRVSLRPQLVMSRKQLRVLDVSGRRVFVPLIGFNAIYRWSSGEGQTSSAYLLGRDTKAEKLAPFRLDLGPRVFGTLGARPLPIGVRK